MPDPTDCSALHRPHVDTDPNDRHRLASSAGGTSGNPGNLSSSADVDERNQVPIPAASPEEMLALLRSATSELWRRSSAQGTTPEEVRRWSHEAATMRHRVVELADAYEEALREQEAGQFVARRITRMVRPHERHLERERRRAAGGMYAGERRSPNRPTQVVVDAEAWAVVKAQAIRSRKAVAAVVGELVVQSLDEMVQSVVQTRSTAPETARRRHPQRRFARLFIDDEAWLQFRERAVQADVPVARLVGLVVEDAAWRLGWRTSGDGSR